MNGQRAEGNRSEMENTRQTPCSLGYGALGTRLWPGADNVQTLIQERNHRVGARERLGRRVRAVLLDLGEI